MDFVLDIFYNLKDNVFDRERKTQKENEVWKL